MRNWISARRVKFQDIDPRGNPVGEPTYGVIVADDEAQAYNNTYQTLNELNAAIAEQGMLALVATDGVDFDVSYDHGLWKGDNYEGSKPL